jgi:hypothetical protein
MNGQESFLMSGFIPVHHISNIPFGIWSGLSWIFQGFGRLRGKVMNNKSKYL